MKKSFLIGLLLLVLPALCFSQQIGPGTGIIGGQKAPYPPVTPGSGTGITVDDFASYRTQLYKVTVSYTNVITAGLTHDVTIGTLPAKSIVHMLVADVTQTFACAVTCTSSTLSATVGSAAGGTQYLASFDIYAAVATFGDANAEVGASMNAAGFTNGGYIPAWGSTSVVSVRFTSVTGNLGTGAATNLSQGSITFYIIASVLP